MSSRQNTERLPARLGRLIGRLGGLVGRLLVFALTVYAVMHLVQACDISFSMVVTIGFVVCTGAVNSLPLRFVAETRWGLYLSAGMLLFGLLAGLARLVLPTSTLCPPRPVDYERSSAGSRAR